MSNRIAGKCGTQTHSTHTQWESENWRRSPPVCARERMNHKENIHISQFYRISTPRCVPDLHLKMLVHPAKLISFFCACVIYWSKITWLCTSDPGFLLKLYTVAKNKMCMEINKQSAQFLMVVWCLLALDIKIWPSKFQIHAAKDRTKENMK